MWSEKPRVLILAICCLAPATVHAQACVLPNQLTNSQLADASQVMANFNAVAKCLNNISPAGSANAVQYNAGGGTLGGIGPLTNGQVVIGSTASAPQAQALTAGSGIQISNAAGAITIAVTGAGGGPGLYGPVLSATPTSAGTGLTTWLNQGSAVVTDSAVGLNINAQASVNDSITGRYMAAPSPPYTIRALIAATRNSNSWNSVGLGWYDGTNKLHTLSYVTQNGSAPTFQVGKYNSPTSFSGTDVFSSPNEFAQPIWLQLHDSGTNVTFAFSQDGTNFVQVFAVAKSSGWLGTSGYSNVIFFLNPLGSRTLGTVMSWTQN